MNADILAARVRQFFREHAGSFGLDRDSLAVDYVLNEGGFVNYSYRIGDARSAYHLKVSTSVEGRESLGSGSL